MADENIATYLNDHLAGSVVALELLEHLEKTHSGSPLEDFFRRLHADISSDRADLQALMARLDISESRTRKASAWLAEKMTEVKLRLDDPQAGSLRLLESLEALSLGIEGKRSLWLALASAAERSTTLKIMDYRHMEHRASEQRDRVEQVRIDTARKALTPGPSDSGSV
ncbi:MAG: hypothetical protein QOI77_1721 [Blastocatellia bacterium]|jgi:hypothetical protein|nr:hypothetical protein [Blastocatellia bacterium]